MVAELRAGYCSHPDPASDPCSGIITKAHTVQNMCGFFAIAELNHVLTVKQTMKAMIETEGDRNRAASASTCLRLSGLLQQA